MLDDDTFDKALDLIKAFAIATDNEIRLKKLSQLLMLEKSMTVSQQCDYAMRLYSQVRQMSVEAIEEMYKFNAVDLEDTGAEVLNELINAQRSNLIYRYNQEAIANAALQALNGLKGLNMPRELTQSLGEFALGSAVPRPNARMN